MKYGISHWNAIIAVLQLSSVTSWSYHPDRSTLNKPEKFLAEASNRFEIYHRPNMIPQWLLPPQYRENIGFHPYNGTFRRDISITENMLLDHISISVMKYMVYIIMVHTWHTFATDDDKLNMCAWSAFLSTVQAFVASPVCYFHWQNNTSLKATTLLHLLDKEAFTSVKIIKCYRVDSNIFWYVYYQSQTSLCLNWSDQPDWIFVLARCIGYRLISYLPLSPPPLLFEVKQAT